MTKRTYLLAKTALKIFCLAAVLLFWLHGGGSVQATDLQERREVAIPIEEIEGLDRLSLEFGATQDTMVLTLEGGSGTKTLKFGPIADTGTDRDLKEVDLGRLNEDRRRLLKAFDYLGFSDDNADQLKQYVFGDGNNVSDDVVYLVYRSVSEPQNFAYNGSDDRRSFLNCEEETRLIVIAEQINDGGDEWKQFDFNNRKIWASITLPLDRSNTNGCLLLDTTLELEGGDANLFALSSNNANNNGCGGLVIHGRGEDDLHKPGVEWLCLTDTNFDGKKGVDNNTRDDFNTVDPHPYGSNNHFIFVENRTWNNDCGGRIILDKRNLATEPFLDAKWQDWRDNCNNGLSSGNENNIKVLNVATLSTEEQGEFLESITFISGSDGSDQLTGGAATDCSNQGAGYSGLNWVFCDILQKLSNAIEVGERYIYEQLRIDRNQYQGENCDSANRATGACNYKKAWANVRNLMTLAIVGTAILMVLATALDFGWFSNYTVKKYLARLIAGVILLIMSWAIGDFIITLANQVGGFVGNLITAPFTNGGSSAVNVDLSYIFSDAGNAGKGLVIGGTIGGGVAVAMAALAGTFTVIPILLTAALGALFILVGFMFIVLRQAVVIALLVFAPLGVALWFLPGSDKMWRLYYKTFLSLVFIYPIIVAVIAFGRVFIWVLLQSQGNVVTNPLTALIAFFVYVGMFAAIPAIFKRFLGVINQITGSQNNPAKGAFDRLKNVRKNYMDQNKQLRKGGRDVKDDEHLAKMRDKKEKGVELTNTEKVKSRAIDLKRRGRRGLPLGSSSVRSGYESPVHNMANMIVAAEEGKRYGEVVKQWGSGALDQKYGLDANDFPAYTQALEEIALGEGEAVGGQQVSMAEQEAALRKLSQFKQDKAFRRLSSAKEGRVGLSNGWSNIVRDGTMFKDFDGHANDVATNSIGDPNFGIGGVPENQLKTQTKDAIEEYGKVYEHNMEAAGYSQIMGTNVAPDIQSLNTVSVGDAEYQAANNFAGSVERVLDSKFARADMKDGAHEALEARKTNHNNRMNAVVTKMSQDISNTANTQGWSAPAYQGYLQGAGVNEGNNLQAEVARQAAIKISSRDGHEGVMREIYKSEDPLVRNSLKAAVKSGDLKEVTLPNGTTTLSSIARTAPHLANLEIDEDGNLGKLEDVDWLKMGLSSQQLTELSDQSATDMKGWFNENLKKARGNPNFRRRIETYSNRDINQAITSLRADDANSELANILDQLKSDIGGL